MSDELTELMKRRGQFLRSEKDVRPYSETENRGMFAPLVHSGYNQAPDYKTGKWDASTAKWGIPGALGGDGWRVKNDILAGRGVTGDEIDGAAGALSGMVATGGMAMPRPANSVGMFGGRRGAETLAKNGETRPTQALALAEGLRLQGATREQILARTNELLKDSPFAGVHYGKDGLPRFEISDHRSTVSSPEGVNGYGRVKDVMDHPDLFRAYEDHARISADWKVDPKLKHNEGHLKVYNGNFNDSMKMNSHNEQSLRSGLLHELQHATQTEEKFARGGSPEEFLKTINIPIPFADKHVFINHGIGAYGKYRRLAGEVESRAVQARRDLTPDERRARAPWLDYDVPDSQQIVRRNNER